MPRLRLALMLTTALLAASAGAATASAADTNPFARASVKITPLPMPPLVGISTWDGPDGLVFDNGNGYSRIDLRNLRTTPSVAVPPGCRLDVIGPTLTAASCWVAVNGPVPHDGRPDHFDVMPNGSGAWTSVPNTYIDDLGGESVRVARAGAHWLELAMSNGRGSSTIYLSRDNANTQFNLADRTQADLDSVDLLTPHTPARTCKGGPALGVHDKAIGRSGQWTLVRHAVRGPKDKLLLGRCGGPKRFVTLCQGSCFQSGAISGNVVAWNTGVDAFVRGLKSGRTRRVHVPGYSTFVMVHGGHALAFLSGTGPANFQFGLVDLG